MRERVSNMKKILLTLSLILITMNVNAKNSSVIMPIPSEGFDPTEAAVTWKTLKDSGIKVVFSTPDGQPGAADPIMVTGKGLGLLKWSMRADDNGRAAYAEMIKTEEFNNPILYSEINVQHYDALVLPGGHAKEMRPYLESSILQEVTADFIKENKIVGAICHGVVLVARSMDPITGRSVLYGRRVTTLPNWMEMTAYKLTKLWMGNYYRTYPETTTQNEVVEVLATHEDFLEGPSSLERDAPENIKAGFVVKDRNLITARWPGDAHLFGKTLVEELKK